MDVHEHWETSRPWEWPGTGRPGLAQGGDLGAGPAGPVRPARPATL